MGRIKISEFGVGTVAAENLGIHGMHGMEQTERPSVGIRVRGKTGTVRPKSDLSSAKKSFRSALIRLIRLIRVQEEVYPPATFRHPTPSREEAKKFSRGFSRMTRIGRKGS